MDAEYEERWCKYCMIKTKQEIIFMPEIPTYKRRRQYKCTQCGKKSWLQGRRPSAESVYWSKVRSEILFSKKSMCGITSVSVNYFSLTIEMQVICTFFYGNKKAS